MLVLTRHVDESIAIGDEIVITVLGIEGDRVKLGISAPRDVPILRHEVYQAVKDQIQIQTHLVEKPEPEAFEALRKLLEEDTLPPEENRPPDKSAEDE